MKEHICFLERAHGKRGKQLNLFPLVPSSGFVLIFGRLLQIFFRFGETFICCSQIRTLAALKKSVANVFIVDAFQHSQRNLSLPNNSKAVINPSSTTKECVTNGVLKDSPEASIHPGCILHTPLKPDTSTPPNTLPHHLLSCLHFPTAYRRQHFENQVWTFSGKLYAGFHI